MPTLVIHGGAGTRSLNPRDKIIFSKSLTRVLSESYRVLEQGGSSLEAVTRAVVMLEDDPLYNAGYGSKIQSDGQIRMSASIMDGGARRFGGCVNVEGVKNPVLLARALMREKDRVLGGRGAITFAKSLGLKFASPFTPHRLKIYRKKKRGKSGTVGAVALDVKGVLAAATSTGGRGFEYPHRVSDSPTIAGNFANRFGAVSATGTGEEIVESGCAAAICAYMEAGWSLERATSYLLKTAKKKGGDFGLISIDRKGRVIAKTNTPLLLWGMTDGKTISLFGRKI